MTRDDAITIAEMVNEVQKGRRGPELFVEGKTTNIGEIWIGLLMEEDDAGLATQAIVHLYSEKTPEVGRLRPVSPADYKDVLRMLRKLNAPPAVEEAEFEREMEPWVKGWVVARIQQSDYRVWPQQKVGYDELQLENPYQRDYVWGEQTMMPEEKQREYEAAGAGLTAAQVGALVASIGA
jgi:hypothetical protein